MPEIDPSLGGVDYLRGLVRVPLRRGMAAAGGVMLFVGSLSACGDSPDARAEGTQTGVTIESETPDNGETSLETCETASAAATKAPSSTPEPAETPLIETPGPPSPTSPTEAAASATPTAESQEGSGGFGALVGSATVAVVANCFDGDMERLYMTSFNSPSGGEFPASLQVSCDTASTVDARIIHDASQIEDTDNVLFIVSDLGLGSGIVPGSGFGPKLVNGDTTPNTRDYAVDVFNINPQSTECYAIGLTEEVHTDTRIISISLDTNNKVTGKTTVSCANFQPGTIH